MAYLREFDKAFRPFPGISLYAALNQASCIGERTVGQWLMESGTSSSLPGRIFDACSFPNPFWERAKRILGTKDSAASELWDMRRWMSFLLGESERLLPGPPRFCPECIRFGYHSLMFQCPEVPNCPVHMARLSGKCPFCKLDVNWNAVVNGLLMACPFCESSPVDRRLVASARRLFPTEAMGKAIEEFLGTVEGASCKRQLVSSGVRELTPAYVQKVASTPPLETTRAPEGMQKDGFGYWCMAHLGLGADFQLLPSSIDFSVRLAKVVDACLDEAWEGGKLRRSGSRPYWLPPLSDDDFVRVAVDGTRVFLPLGRIDSIRDVDFFDGGHHFIPLGSMQNCGSFRWLSTSVLPSACQLFVGRLLSAITPATKVLRGRSPPVFIARHVASIDTDGQVLDSLCSLVERCLREGFVRFLEREEIAIRPVRPAPTARNVIGFIEKSGDSYGRVRIYIDHVANHASM